MLALAAAALAGCADDSADAASAAGSALVEVPTAQALVDDLAGLESPTVVLNFWATWCAPCIAEFPILVAYDRAREGDVEVRFVSVDDPSQVADVRAFLANQNVTEPSYLYTGPGDLPSQLNPLFPGGAIPVTMILDGEGMVEYTHLGSLTREKLEQLVANAEAARS